MTIFRHRHPVRAFTLMDVTVTITIIATIAVMVAPGLTDNTHLQVAAATRVLTSDLEFAQVCTIATPDNPVVVRFDPDENSYWLARAATPDTPITRSDTGEEYRVVLGQGRASGADEVTFEIDGLTADTITFNSSGGLADFSSSPRITFSLGDYWIELGIASTTGRITETSGSNEAPDDERPGASAPSTVVASASSTSSSHQGDNGLLNALEAVTSTLNGATGNTVDTLTGLLGGDKDK